MAVAVSSMRRNGRRPALIANQPSAASTRSTAANVSPLTEAGKPVVAALKDYQNFLENDLLPRADGDFRIGREKFVQKLELDLNSGLGADEVLAEAEKKHGGNREILEALASFHGKAGHRREAEAYAKKLEVLNGTTTP